MPLTLDQFGPCQTRLLVLQATQFCNIDCSYCYVPNRTNKRRMDTAVAAAIRRKIVAGDALAKDALVLWHAGEPMAVGLPAFAALREALFGGERPSTMREQVQTNGTLINAEWATYFREQGISVGLSIDGPADVHDRFRVTRSGEGTLNRTLAGARCLHDHGVPFSIICVVGEKNSEDPRGLLDYLRSLSPRSIGFSVEKIEGANDVSSLNQSAHMHRMRNFFFEVITRNFSVDDRPTIREFALVKSALKAVEAERLSDELKVGRIVSIGIDGRVGLFSPELLTNPAHEVYGDYSFGNILEDELSDVFARAMKSRLFLDAFNGAKKCKSTCDFWRFCAGGSPSAKISEHGTADVAATSYCMLAKRAGTLGVLEGIAESRASQQKV